MTRSRSILVVLAACCMLAIAGVAAAQYSVVAVSADGNVILRGPSGIRSYQVPAGTTFNADGKSGVAVGDLKPGMNLTGLESGIANWKTSDVMVHEETNAEVVAVAGNSLLIKGKKGVEKYEWKEANEIAIVKDGKMVDASALHVGDRITGMIVQKAVPAAPKAAAASTAADDAAKKAAADKAAADAAAKKAADDAAKKAAADKAAADAAAKKAAADKAAAEKAAADKAAADKAAADKAAADKAAADAAAAKAAKKKLPKTASEMPLVGLVGVLSLAAGAGLTAIRKSRSK